MQQLIEAGSSAPILVGASMTSLLLLFTHTIAAGHDDSTWLIPEASRHPEGSVIADMASSAQHSFFVNAMT